LGSRCKNLSTDNLIPLQGRFKDLAFDFEIVFNGSFGQVAAVDKEAFTGACILAQDIDNRFMPGQTARLFFVSTTEFDIA